MKQSTKTTGGSEMYQTVWVSAETEQEHRKGIGGSSQDWCSKEKG